MAREVDPGTPLGSSGLTYRDAVDIQERLRSQLVERPPRSHVRTVAGADVAFTSDDMAVAAIIVFSWPDLERLDMAIAAQHVTFPYIPGLLSFREVPVIAEAFGELGTRPDVLFCDGQGYAHPRRFGLACHVGVILDVPTIGCAKSRLVGKADEPGPKRGSATPLVDRGETIGAVVRTRDNVRPLYVSHGQMMDLDTAVRMVLEAGRGYRLPEPTRQADALVAKAKSQLT